jgi:hypothetical protein
LLDGIYPLDAEHQPTFAKARAFAEHCAALSDENGCVPLTRFHLDKIPKLAPNVVLLGVADRKNPVVRLAGTRVVEFLGRDPTGMTMSELPADSEFGSRTRHIVQEVLRTRRSILNQPGRTRLKEKNYLHLETLTVPLTDDAAEIVKLATIYDYRFEDESVAI